MARRVLAARDPRADGSIRSGLDSDVVGRVGMDEMDRRAGEESIEVRDRSRVAAEKSVATQDPEIARARHGIVRRIGHREFVPWRIGPVL